MKLRNKKTGEIVELTRNKIFNYDIHLSKFNSLAELNDEWEDYEEPKRSYYLTSWGEVKEYSREGFNINHKLEIGNYFETKEQAEKAVEKLKAFKRLKDKGFNFIGVRPMGKVIDFDMPKSYHCVAFDKNKANEDALEFYNDLMFLFGANNA